MNDLQYHCFVQKQHQKALYKLNETNSDTTSIIKNIVLSLYQMAQNLDKSKLQTTNSM